MNTNADIHLYHVTTADNWKAIQQDGRMVPQIGPRSQKLDEDRAIFFFKSRADAEDGAMNWLGDEFDEDERLVLLKLTLPKDAPDYHDNNLVEATYTGPIDIKYIQCIDHEF